jgi:predicted nucleotidyltransferase
MRRERLTKKLQRILRTIESGNTPTPVRKLWVFGSYARGALDCGDLDLAIVVDQPSQEWLDRNIGLFDYDLKRMEKFEQLVRNALRKRGERVEIVIRTKDNFIQDFFKSVPINDAMLIWSEDEPDWQAKIKSIKPIPSAGRYIRPYPIDLKRTGTSRDVMEQVLWLIQEKRLTMETIDMNDVEPRLSQHQSTMLEQWRSSRCYGKDTLDVLAYAFDWMHSERQRFSGYLHSATEIISVSGTHLVHIGRIDFGYALGWLFDDKKAMKLCLIPHLRKRSSNEMFVIERGSRWTGNLLADLKDRL